MNKSQEELAEQLHIMNDLLYTDEYSQEIEQKIKNKFVSAKTEISCDDIHGQRLSIDLPEINRKEYLRFIIQEGYGDLSFYIQMVLNSRNFKLKEPNFDNQYNELKSILGELKVANHSTT